MLKSPLFYLSWPPSAGVGVLAILGCPAAAGRGFVSVEKYLRIRKNTAYTGVGATCGFRHPLNVPPVEKGVGGRTVREFSC